MDNQEIISVEHVSMRFSLASEKVTSFKEYVIKTAKAAFIRRVLGFKRCKLQCE